MYKKFKLIAYKVIDNSFSWLLWKVSESARLKLFRMVGRNMGVQFYSCSGDLGIYEGNIEDKFVLPVYLFSHTWEPILQGLLSEHIFKNNYGTYLDIGANIGLTAIPLALKREITIYAFEPEPTNYFLLRKNIFSNAVESKISALNCALYSQQGTLDFEISNENMGDHRVRISSSNGAKNNVYGETTRSVIQVNAEKLDNMLDADKLSHPIAIKIDTQGAELQVLKGAANFLKKVDYLIIEFWPYGLRQLGDSPKELIEIVEQFAYAAIYDRNAPRSNYVPELVSVNNIIEKMKQMDENPTLTDTPMKTKDMDIIFSRHQNLDG